MGVMFSDWNRRRAARRVKPGDGHELKPFRWWQLFSRSLFHLQLDTPHGHPQRWSLDVRLGGDSNGDILAKLYRESRHQATSKLPARFPVPGGTLEVAASDFGLKRCHYLGEDGREQQLVPDPSSAEGLRARLEHRHPAAGRLLGMFSVLILLVALVLGVPQLLETLSAIPVIAENIGSFISPFRFPVWFNISLTVAALLASTERALRLRHSKLLDGGGGLFDGTG